jgi:acyl carrier protein phosphodiesterase
VNYLAHAFFSRNDPGLLVGNFIADHVRGNKLSQFEPRIIEGIKLHRKIDTFTDQHPEFRFSKRLFYDGFEKYSGILVDIFFDHLLAKKFGEFSTSSLTEFSEETYEVYSKNAHVFPPSSNRFLEYVLKNNIYSSYATEEGIEKVLYHLSHRMRHQVRLDHSMKLFMDHEQTIERAFESFMKDAISEFSAINL